MKSYFTVFKIGIKNIYRWGKSRSGDLGWAYFLVFLSFITLQMIKNNDLNQRTAYAIGVITKIERSRHGKRSHFEFYVRDKIYTGVDGINIDTKLKVGDSVFVAYEYTNPRNYEVECYYESRLDRSKLPDTVFYRQPIDNQRRPLKFEE